MYGDNLHRYFFKTEFQYNDLNVINCTINCIALSVILMYDIINRSSLLVLDKWISYP